jgi:hypothetical protein
MTGYDKVGRELAKGAGLVVAHVLAIVTGLILMITGLGMGVSIVLLPIGIPVGLVGLLVFLWGLFGWYTTQPVSPAPPDSH